MFQCQITFASAVRGGRRIIRATPAVGRTVRRRTQIVVIDARIAEARSRPRILFGEEEHTRGVHDHRFLLYVLNSLLPLRGYVIPRIAVEVGIHAVAVLRPDRNGLTITASTAHHSGYNAERRTQVNVFILQIGPEAAGKIRVLVEILAPIVPSTPRRCVPIELTERIREGSILVIQTHPARHPVLFHVVAADNGSGLLRAFPCFHGNLLEKKTGAC